MVNTGQPFLQPVEIQLAFVLRIKLLPQLLNPRIARVLTLWKVHLSTWYRGRSQILLIVDGGLAKQLTEQWPEVIIREEGIHIVQIYTCRVQ